MINEIEILAGLIAAAERIVVFTGAGISTESGIPDFRSKGGVWDRFRPVTFQEFLASEEKRVAYWDYKYKMMTETKNAKPNKGHHAIVVLEEMNKLRGIITQNIDGLHQDAGSSPNRIVELHGTNRQILCLECGDILPCEVVCMRLAAGEKTPLCTECGGLLKPNTISFGQMLDPKMLQTATAWVRDCDLLLALGSSLVVEPAASLPLSAKQSGAKLAIVTLSETPLDSIADLKMSSAIGETLSQAIVQKSA